MKKYFVTGLLFISSCFADPFFGDALTEVKTQTTQAEEAEKFVKNEKNSTACNPPEHRQALNLPVKFAQLKFIGVIKKNEEIKALFMNEQHQLFDFKSDDYLMTDDIQIKQIQLNAIYYIAWREVKNCQVPEQIILKL